MEAKNCGAIEARVPLVVEDDSFNAYADISNQVGINTGLLEKAGSDEEIAFILAHEYGHVMGAHPSTKASNTMFGALIGSVIGAAADAAICNPGQACGYDFTESLGGAGAAIGSTAYSEDQELEADYFAGLILTEAGIELDAGSESLSRVALMSSEGNDSAFAFRAMLRTHPLGDRRLARWTVNRRALEYAIENNLGNDELLIRDAAHRAASGNGEGPVVWANPKTGSSGAAWVDGDWTAFGGQICRRTMWRNDNRTLKENLRSGFIHVCEPRN